MSVPTSNRNWPYPDEWLDPYYSDLYTMFESVDQDVQNLWDAIASSGGRKRAVIDIVDNTLTPPSEVSGNRYILNFLTGGVHANWDGASAGDIVEFDGALWVAEAPEEGIVTFVDNQNSDYRYIDDGTPAWERAKEINDDVTVANVALYVDAITGSDAAGDGSVGKPYATITKAHEQVPHLLKHAVQIIIAEGVYTEFPLVIEHECEDNGQLIFDGGDLDIYSGPHTVASITAVNTLSAQDIVVTGAGWVPDQFVGYFAKITSGANSGYYLGIISNTTDTMRVINTLRMPSAGHTFTVGYPVVQVNLTAYDNINAKVYDKSYQKNDYWMPARLGIGFINFNVADRLIIKDTSAFLPCLDLNLPMASLIAINSQINSGEPFPDTARAFSQAGVNSYEVLPFYVQNSDIEIINSIVQNVISMSAFVLFSKGSCTLGRSCVEGNGAYLDNAKVEFDYCYFQTPGSTSVLLERKAHADFFYCHFEEGDNCVGLNMASSIYLANSGCTAANYDYYGIYLQNASKAIETDASPTLSGLTGDVYFYQTNSVAPYPAAGASLTDSQGSLFVHER